MEKSLNSFHYFQDASKASPLAKTIGPILAQVGFGGFIGFGLGFFSKKLGKIIAVVLALIFVCIQILIYYDYIPGVDWTRLGKGIAGAIDENFLDTVWNLIIHNLPFAGSFTVGFLWGLRKG